MATPAPPLPRHAARRRSADRALEPLDAAWLALGAQLRRPGLSTARALRTAQRVDERRESLRRAEEAALDAERASLAAAFRLGRDSPEDLVSALALAAERARRSLGMTPRPPQLATAAVMLRGGAAELPTGEGKTLAAGLAAAVRAWRGRGVHVLTVNDYLASRDAAWMAPLFGSLGLTVAAVTQGTHASARREAYRADITYSTGKEAAADFLRDALHGGETPSAISACARRLAGRDLWASPAAEPVQRGLDAAIVDEADAVLIDEGVTPLIISIAEPRRDEAGAYARAAQIAAELRRGPDYAVRERERDVELTAAGEGRLASLAEHAGGVWSRPARRAELVATALRAAHLYRRDQEYVVRDGRVVIIDTATGRPLPDRTWRAGLHEAVEAKEGLTIGDARRTLASISFQRFFRTYRSLSGMTGTARELRGELWRTYRLPVTVIPPHRPSRRSTLPERIARTDAAKRDEVAALVDREHRLGRPVLVGTPSVEASEAISRALSGRGIEHRVLNAVRHRDEAEIVAGAGARGAVTVATNMAGRGTDIALGPGVTELGGLLVIAMERNASRRLDRQLAGRAARQGDPGGVVVVASPEDALPRRFAPLLARLARAVPAPAMTRLALSAAQRACERADRRRRRSVERADEKLDEALTFTRSS